MTKLRKTGLTAVVGAGAVAMTFGMTTMDAAHAASTTKVIIQLQGADNNGHLSKTLNIPGSGSASYYAAGAWHPVTELDPNNPSMVQTQLAPGTYAFAVTYNGTRQQKTVTVGDTTTGVYFHAALVNVELQGSDNNGHVGKILDIPGSGSASYYAGGWQSVTTKDPNNMRIVQAEMLPGTYSFAATYNGTRDQKQFTVAEPNVYNGENADQTVYFHAALVNVELQGSDNNGHVGKILDIPESGSASYYAGGWKSVTDTNVNNPNMVQAEMLPGNYSFAATYNGTRDQKQFTVVEPNANNGANANQTVYFHAALVLMQSQSLDALGHVNGIVPGVASYYAGGWQNVTTPDPNNPSISEAEMLPGKYSFASSYNGTRIQKQQIVVEPNSNNGDHADQIVYFGFPG